MNNKYWLYLDSYVYVSIVNNNIILYNTLNKKHIYLNNNNKILSIINQLIEPNNNYVIEVDSSENIEFMDFIKKIRKFYMGDIIPIEEGGKKPFQFNTFYKIHNRDYYDDISKEYIIKNNKTIADIKSITFYINSFCEKNCHFCNSAYKQFLMCFKNKDNKELDFDLLKDNIKKFTSSVVTQININGGNVIKYSKFKELMIFLDTINKNINVYINYLNILEIEDYLHYFKKEGKVLKIYIHPHFELNLLFYIKKILNTYNIELIFIIKSEKELLDLNNIIGEYDIKAYSIQPLYENNMSFFKKNVFNTKKDIFERKIEMNELIVNNEINDFYYGTLIVMNDGQVYSNLNTSSIGNIYSDSTKFIINNALNETGSWKKTRKKIEPCNNCVYNVFCPPIGNYEHVIGKNNLCKITKN